jgi:hypothetical protein
MAQQAQLGNSDKVLGAGFSRPSGFLSGAGAAVAAHCRAEDRWRMVTQRAVRPHLVVVLAPPLESFVKVARDYATRFRASVRISLAKS